MPGKQPHLYDCTEKVRIVLRARKNLERNAVFFYHLDVIRDGN